MLVDKKDTHTQIYRAPSITMRLEAVLIVAAVCLGRSAHAVPKSKPDIPPARSFAIHDDAFYLDGKPMQIMSGEIHYSRVPAELWGDRLRRCVCQCQRTALLACADPARWVPAATLSR